MWFYEAEDQIRGPFTERDLERLLISGDISAETRVRGERAAGWITVGEVLDVYWAAGKGAHPDDPDMVAGGGGNGGTGFGDTATGLKRNRRAAPRISGMPEAVRYCFSNYVTFSGRGSRPEFWWFQLALVLGSVLFAVLDGALFEEDIEPLQFVWGLATLLPGVAAGVRRLHDIGRSGWWYLIGLVPVIGLIVLIVFWASRSEPKENAWGDGAE